jgi:hypothetical protein
LEAIVVVALFAASIAQSLPPLLNAAGTQSDAAIVGLQAMHALRGETSWFLWGSGYQTSMDAFVAAAFFRALGVTPIALMLSTFTGYLLLIGFAYATVRRRFDAVSAALLVLPLVLMAPPVHIYAFYPPRQLALTLLFAAIWVLEGGTDARSPKARIALGAFVAGLACFADPYALLFLPAVGVFVLLLSQDGADRRAALQRFGAGLAGAGVGLVPFWLLSRSAGASRGVFHLSGALFTRNVALLADECLPYLLGTKVKRFSEGAGVTAWHPPEWFHAVQVLGASVLLAGMVLGGVAALGRRVPADARRLGLAGALMLPVTLAAFSISAMVMDRLSARYLVAMVLMAPLALAPVVHLVGRRAFAAMLAPYLLSIGVAGWLGYGDNVDGFRIRLANGRARDETELATALHERGLHYGLADYWVAYRLTFLMHEDPIIVPWHAKLDRYPPYRRAADAEPTVAYVYDPYWSQEDLSYRKREFRGGKAGFEPGFEEFRVGRYSVLVLRRSPPGGLRVAGANEPATPEPPARNARESTSDPQSGTHAL